MNGRRNKTGNFTLPFLMSTNMIIHMGFFALCKHNAHIMIWFVFWHCFSVNDKIAGKTGFKQ